jgi:hypothetical protein
MNVFLIKNCGKLAFRESVASGVRQGSECYKVSLKVKQFTQETFALFFFFVWGTRSMIILLWSTLFVVLL